MRRLWLAVGALLPTTSPAASADGLAERWDANLSLRGDAWSGSRQLDDTRGIYQLSTWGKAKLNLDPAGTLVADGWLQGRAGRESHTRHGRLRELYWRHSSGPVEVKLGRQLVLWGRADSLNPTNNLSPRDFTLLTPEDNDQRYGNEAAQASIDVGLGTLTGLWFPRAATHTIPLRAGDNVSFSVEKPPRQSQQALKWELNGEGIDGSVSYFHGVDPMPDLNLRALTSSGLDVAVRNHRASFLGADVSLARSGVVWRAEVARMFTDSTGPDDFTHKKPQIWFVGGGEWTLSSTWKFGVQATLQKVYDFQSPDNLSDPVLREVALRQAATSNQTAATQRGFTWRLAGRWWNDTLLAETSGVMVWPSQSGIWRTKLDYAVDNDWHVQMGTDYYFGPEHTFFGQLKKNNLVFIQVRYGWSP